MGFINQLITGGAPPCSYKPRTIYQLVDPGLPQEAAGMDLSTEAGEGWGGFRDLLLLGFGAVLGAAPGNDGNVGLGMEEKCKALEGS